MPSYTVCIVEDNAECAAALIDRVAASPFSEGLVIHEMASRAELESFVSEGRAIDILITDINLGTDAADGISMVRDLFPMGSKTQVIYATGYIEYCTPVYETQHVYFLVKPIRQSALDDALKKALENLAGQNAQDGQTEQVGQGARADVPPEIVPLRAHIQCARSDDRSRRRPHRVSGKRAPQAAVAHRRRCYGSVLLARRCSGHAARRIRAVP